MKDHRTLLLLVQATHQIMQLALHRLVASLFDCIALLTNFVFFFVLEAWCPLSSV